MIAPDSIPSDSLRYAVPYDLNYGARSGAVTAMHVLLWTPQIIWGGLAILRLFRLLRRGTHRWLTLSIPGLMVVGAVILQMFIFGVWPFFDVSHGEGPAFFFDTALPSLIVLFILFFMYFYSLIPPFPEDHTYEPPDYPDATE